MAHGGFREAGSSPESVLRYARLAPEKLNSVAERIERRIEPLVEQSGVPRAPASANVTNAVTYPLRLLNWAPDAIA